MTEQSNDWDIIEEALNAHHVYLAPRKPKSRAPLRHDAEGCEVDLALEALSRLRTQHEREWGALKSLEERWRRLIQGSMDPFDAEALLDELSSALSSGEPIVGVEVLPPEPYTGRHP